MEDVIIQDVIIQDAITYNNAPPHTLSMVFSRFFQEFRRTR